MKSLTGGGAGAEAAVIWRAADLCGGQLGLGSEDLHALVQTCAEARVAHICRTSGRQESEQLLGTIVGQYRRLISTCAVRAQAMCTLARVGLITPAARDAARRRQVAMRLEEQMREEGAVDGLPPGPRLGQKRPMSWPLGSRMLPRN